MEKPGIISATLAKIYLDQGYVEQALEIYKELFKKEPHNDFYKKQIALLKKDLKAKR
ncbi:MAG TPA: hypothetical protein VMT62_03320 [Syntrophorhabdaceae bacterium]|nr:hypothetical protein [Syntrophorhabdaceae bacterium]